MGVRKEASFFLMRLIEVAPFHAMRMVFADTTMKSSKYYGPFYSIVEGHLIPRIQEPIFTHDYHEERNFLLIVLSGLFSYTPEIKC